MPGALLGILGSHKGEGTVGKLSRSTENELTCWCFHSCSACSIKYIFKLGYSFKSVTSTFGEKPKWGGLVSLPKERPAQLPHRTSHQLARRSQQQVHCIDWLEGKWKARGNSWVPSEIPRECWEQRESQTPRKAEKNSKWELIIEFPQSISTSVLKPEVFDF